MTAEHSLPGTPLRFGALCGPAKLANLHAKWALSAIWLMLSRLDASSMSGCAPGLQPAAVHSGVSPCVYAEDCRPEESRAQATTMARQFRHVVPYIGSPFSDSVGGLCKQLFYMESLSFH